MSNPFDTLNQKEPSTDIVQSQDNRYVVMLNSPTEGLLLVRDATREGYPLLFDDAQTAQDYALTTVKPFVKPDVVVGYALYRNHLETPLIVNVSQA